MEINGPDTGLFGPDSESWRVLRERSVLMGGLRALLMHAVHPVVADALARTHLYQDDPWGRHERTLRLIFTVIFGTRSEASAAVREINAAHRSVRGIDPVDGFPYTAGDPSPMLWVHASLESSFLLFERLTVGSLDDASRQRFHSESALVANLLGLSRSRIPPDTDALENYITETADSGLLRRTDSSRRLVDFMRRRERGIAGVKLWAVAFLALHTLPPQIRRLYDVDHRALEQYGLATLCGAIRLARPVRPRSSRIIGPARAAEARMRGEPAQVSETPILARQ
ncbi:oxygenase MpaB family protein [Nocardia sp. CA-119907]|uniref:oxygenase MpaB family protein n=1 Tax=Nocardia sp. CA-119907 TaxID=3239973 RepID=UPI003D96AD65